MSRGVLRLDALRLQWMVGDSLCSGALPRLQGQLAGAAGAATAGSGAATASWGCRRCRRWCYICWWCCRCDCRCWWCCCHWRWCCRCCCCCCCCCLSGAWLAGPSDSLERGAPPWVLLAAGPPWATPSSLPLSPCAAAGPPAFLSPAALPGSDQPGASWRWALWTLVQGQLAPTAAPAAGAVPAAASLGPGGCCACAVPAVTSLEPGAGGA